jgi:hypothetical protein
MPLRQHFDERPVVNRESYSGMPDSSQKSPMINEVENHPKGQEQKEEEGLGKKKKIQSHETKGKKRKINKVASSICRFIIKA